MDKKNGKILLALALPALAAGVWAFMATDQNLQTAYSAELNVKLRYEAFAAKADEENHPGPAALFRALAFSEGIHAANLAKAITAAGGDPLESVAAYEVKDTEENLKEGLRMEEDEIGRVYPSYLMQAAADGNDQAATSFKWELASERGHSALLTEMLGRPGEWKTRSAYLICRTCGYTTNDLSLSKCPSCSHPREDFVLM